LKIGEKALVHLDAIPTSHCRTVESIDPMGTPGDFSPKLRKFSATFSIKGQDSRLMPDLPLRWMWTRKASTAQQAG